MRRLGAARPCRLQAHASLHAIVTAAAQPSVVVRHMRDVCASHGVSHATVQVEDEEAARLACGKAVALHNVSGGCTVRAYRLRTSLCRTA